jgi:hypothetical protein
VLATTRHLLVLGDDRTVFWPRIENCCEINLMASGWPGESDMTCAPRLYVRNSRPSVEQFPHRDQLPRLPVAIDAGTYYTAIAA